MSHRTPHAGAPDIHAWSPETETREDVKALLRRRSALTESEVVVLRTKLFPTLYDKYVETLRYVVRSRGATGAVEMELVHDALGNLFDEARSEGLPESIHAKLLSLASGVACNHMRREGRNPATQALPTSSKETPLSFPRPELAFDLQERARLLFPRLSEDHQKIVKAVVLDELTVRAAARELGIPRTTAGSRLTAALTLMEEWAEEILSPSDRHL